MNVDELSDNKKMALGALTVWPIFYMFLFFGFIFLFVFKDIAAGPGKGGPPTAFFVIFPIHLLTVLFQFALIGFYVYHAVKTTRITQDMRVVWILLVIFVGFIAMPVYFYIYIWKAPDEKQLAAMQWAKAYGQGYYPPPPPPYQQHPHYPPPPQGEPGPPGTTPPAGEDESGK